MLICLRSDILREEVGGLTRAGFRKAETGECKLEMRGMEPDLETRDLS